MKKILLSLVVTIFLSLPVIGQNSELTGPIQNSIDSRVPGDEDNDGTPDNLDQDEDNDAVPDVLDGCSTINIANTIGIGSPIVSGSSYTIEETTITYTTTNSTAFYGYVAGNHGDAIRIQGDLTDQLQMSFSTPIEHVTFKISDFDDLNDEKITINAYNETNTLINLSATNVPFLGSNPSRSGNLIQTTSTSGNCEGDDDATDGVCAAYLYIPGKVSKIVFIVDIDGNSSLRITELNYCLKDTDKDNIPDFQDLDSDNDGIPDIVEAGGVDTNGDGTSDNVTDYNGNGIPDVYDFRCTNGVTGSGYATAVHAVDNTNNGEDALGIGDLQYAQINSLGSLELEFADVIPAGNNVVVRHRPLSGTGQISFTVERSSDGITYSNSETFSTSFNGAYAVLGYDLIGGNTKFIKISNLSTQSLGIDYAKYSFGAFSDCAGINGLQILNLDTDTDGLTNAQDLDSDNDGIFDIIETGEPDADNNAMADNFADVDDDGYNDNYDGDVGNDGVAENSAAAIILTGADTNDDGVPDSYANANTDNSGFPNPYDIDTDDDGIPDNIEAQPTIGYIIPAGTINPTTGINTAYLFGIVPEDTDGDTTPDYQDSNSDGDAKLDIEENGDVDTLSGDDADQDGLDDNFDSNNVTFDTNDEVSAGTPAELATIFGDADGDILIGGNLDYRDLFDINPPASGSLDFDGFDDYVEAPVSVLNSLNEFTISFWIKPETVPIIESNRFFVLGQKGTFEITIQPGENNTEIHARHLYGIGQENSVGVPIDVLEWMHYAVTVNYTAERIQAFVNGVPISISGMGGPKQNNSNPLRMGSKEDVQPSVGFNFDGWLDEIRIFNKVLTPKQIQQMVYQEIVQNGDNLSGTIINKNIGAPTEPIEWTDLEGYYPITDIVDGKIIDESDNNNDGVLFNISTILPQTAPMPYETQADGLWTEEATWLHGNVWDIEDVGTNKDWSIVQIHNNITTEDSHTNLGLFIDSDKTFSVLGDQAVNNSWYFELDGTLDLADDSQLIQTNTSDLVTSGEGKILRRQEGNTDFYWYNYWSSSIGAVNATTLSDNNAATNNANNTPFNIKMLKQGDGEDIDFTSEFNPPLTDPVTISTIWLYTYQNGVSYDNWLAIDEMTAITPGLGYTQKGTGAATLEQQYIFEGKPNNGTILITADDVDDDEDTESDPGFLTSILLGNPYPSALDARKFISDNSGVIEGTPPPMQGTILLWEQWAGTSHLLAEYEGGYGYINYMATERAYQHPDIPIANPTLPFGIKTPSFYIPVGQGFFVEVVNDGEIQFNNGQRIFKKEADADETDPEDGSVFFSPDTTGQNNTDDPQDSMKLIRLEFAVSSGATRRFVLGFSDLTTDGFDYGYDGGLIDNIPEDDMASLFNGQPYVLQAYSPITPEKEIDLNFKASGNHSYSLEIVELKNMDITQEIFLRDNQEGILWDLRQGPYTFTATAGQDTDRFDMVFQNETLSTSDEVLNDVLIYVNNNQEKLFVKGMTEQVASLSLTNMIGQQVKTFSSPENQTLENGLNVGDLSAGVYLVTLTTGNNLQLNKKIILE